MVFTTRIVGSEDVRRRELFEKFQPNNPSFNSKEARRQSFVKWPKRMKQTPEDLAEAGFYFTDRGDQVKCFSCGCEMSDWEDEDVPWEVHAQKCINYCPYFNYMKGKEFFSTREESEDDILRLSKLDLRREDHRRRTLKRFPITWKEDHLTPAARNGLYYSGTGKYLRCAYCKRELRNWEEGHDQRMEHNTLSPNCPNTLRNHSGTDV